ncbi:recombinase family protein [Roseomonas gilardii]|uniref:recombinase family protein n=1 Tax=Roseomonas gilardii TaxID=257708 RepID=UPI0011A2E8EE|nr:recombinase family protein [Roseomonas gilardii]
MNALSPKLEPRHLQRRAIVYVRQSTARQVLVNQESTRRQYQLAERARQMGWSAPQVEVIDEDLGLSGASSHARTGFQRLVAAIGLGEVGIVLVTEVSRLSRLNSDWHRVIELCALFQTLIADEDGLYCPQDPNDRLLLGVKGTLFAAELHILHARMRGNLLNKARRGELALRLPVGYRRLGDGTVVQDPDEAVRAALARIFERFAVLRNARAVQRHFAEHRLPMPRLIQQGAEAGRIVWVAPTYQMIQQVLTSPVYAGVFVYGRRRQEISPGDPPGVAVRRQPVEEWDIVVPGVYPAYLSHDQYLLNRRHLQDNLYNFTARRPGAPREGRALLQGLVVCGRCGRRMSVSHGSRYRRYECRRAQLDYGTPQCQAFPAVHLDRAAGALFLEAVRPAALETTLAALAALEQERQALDRHWQLRLERARYDVQRAQRQYDAIEPENRLVARTLETRWNQALAAFEQLEQDYAMVRRTELLPLDVAEQEAVRQLAGDLPALWSAATTTEVDRKRLLRLVITEVVLTVDAPARRAEVTVVWSGGASTRHEVRCPPPGQHVRTDTAVLQRLGELAQHHPDHQIADRLNAEGLRTRTGQVWTYARVHSMRKQHGIATACPLHTRDAIQRADGMVPIKVAAQRLGVSSSLLHVWVGHGVLAHDQRRPASRVWVRLTEDDQTRLDGSSPVALKLPRLAEVQRSGQLSTPALWEKVRQGEYRAFRSRHGQSWEWRLQRSPAAVGREREEPHHHA